MSNAHAGARLGASCESSNAMAAGLADWLYLAAAPTFAIMALVTAVLGDGPADGLCSAAGASQLAGMMPMYLLMSAFHAAPWLKLLAGRRSGAAGPDSVKTTWLRFFSNTSSKG